MKAGNRPCLKGGWEVGHVEEELLARGALPAAMHATLWLGLLRQLFPGACLEGLEQHQLDTDFFHSEINNDKHFFIKSGDS